jgi:hypothetical protein
MRRNRSSKSACVYLLADTARFHWRTTRLEARLPSSGPGRTTAAAAALERCPSTSPSIHPKTNRLATIVKTLRSRQQPHRPQQTPGRAPPPPPRRPSRVTEEQPGGAPLGSSPSAISRSRADQGHGGLRHPHHELGRMARLNYRKRLGESSHNGELLVAWTGVKTGRCSKCGDVCPGDTKRVNVGKRYAELCGSCRRVRSNLRNVGLIG